MKLSPSRNYPPFMEPEGSLPCSPMNVILRQMNLVHTLIPYFFNAHFNIILHVNLDLQSDVFSL
jgi:hypothetical protein